MPMFLSKKRDTPPPARGGQTITTYERNAPSNLRYFAFGRPTVGIYILYYHLAMVARLITIAIAERTGWYTIKTVNTTWIPLKKTAMIPINNPDGALALPHGHRGNPQQNSFLAKYDANVPTPIYRGKKQFQVNLLPRLQDEDIGTFMAMKTISKPITAPADSLSPLGYAAYIDILNIVSTVALILRHGVEDTTEGICSIIYSATAFKGDIKEDVTATTISESGVVENSMAEVSVKKALSRVSIDSKSTISILADQLTGHAWGMVSDFNRASGLAVPYRRDYSTPDTAIATQFLSHFFAVCDKSTLDDSVEGLPEYMTWLCDWWKKEICNTTQGEWLAHIMKVFVMCKEVGCGAYVCVQNGMYLGCIMEGHKWKVQVGKDVYQGTNVDLETEMMELDAHSASLDKILDLIQVPKPRIAPTTMRSLRELVIGQSLTPSVKAQISELLVTLDFGALPDSVNATTVKNTVNLLCDPSVPIKDDLYLVHTEFWSTDRTRLILGRFGARAPTLMTGSKKYRLAPNAHGQGVNSAEPFSAHPPPVLQLAIVPIQRCATDWDYVLKSGMANMEGITEITGSKVVFRGQSGKDVWTTCTGYIHLAINRTLGQGATSTNLKRDQEELEEGELEDDTPRVVKKPKFDPFA